MFDVMAPSQTARPVQDSTPIGVDSSAALDGVGDKTVRFRAVALDARVAP